MNKKVILTGKAILSTVMASSVACSTFTTSIYAQTSEAEVKELENEVEKVIPESGNDGDKTQENEMMPDSVVEESEITSFDGETVLLQNLDYAKLDSAIAQVESGLEDESKYTPETWANFKPVYDKAKGAKSDGSLTQEDVDQLASDLISAYVDLRKDPGAETAIDIKVSTEKTDHNTVIVSLDSEELLVKPEAKPDQEVNEKTWVYHYKNRRYVYQKEYTQNGTYTVLCEDIYGNSQEMTFTIEGLEEENTPPTIEAKDKTITVGEEFNREIALKGVSAYDKEDGDLTDKIEVESTVDRHKVGEYTVTYTVSDTQGATATKTIKVTVKAKEENKEESKKEEKEDKVKTSVSVSTGLFAGMTGISALGMGILETLKRRKK